VFGSIRIRQVLNDTAEYLQSLYDQTLKMMNEGATLDDIAQGVKPPAALAEKPYLQPVYDEPEFIVRNVWRLEGGWYDGIASHLKPAPHRAQAAEIAAMAGGADVLLGRALQRMSDGELALAAHLIDWAVAAAPENRAAHEARMRIYAARAAESASTMAHGIFRAAVIESAARAGVPPPEDARKI
jgi:alkyl sulfatase BDS1-like metallo-beta-lactamase superfamily hydrolase